MQEKEIGSWTAVQMYCPNCGTLNVGYQAQEGKYRFRCKRCSEDHAHVVEFTIDC